MDAKVRARDTLGRWRNEAGHAETEDAPAHGLRRRGPQLHVRQPRSGMAENGLHGQIYINRNRVTMNGVDCRSAVPRLFSLMPYRFVRERATHATEAAFLRELRPGEIAYLWPEVSLRTHEIVHRMGNPIVLEGINTRMVCARAALDKAYAAAGLAPQHGISDQRIAEEEDKLRLARAIFAPSPAVEASLEGASLAPDGVISASYGVRLTGRRRAGVQRRDRPIFLFVGYVCIRKGVHQLLRAWSKAKIDGTLVLAGAIEPAVQKLCASELGSRNVKCLGFVRDVNKLYHAADAFVPPSFEEGDPLVTYEAAAHSLPVIASPMGAGRIGAETGCVALVDPAEPESIAAVLRRFADSCEEREMWRARANAAVQGYGWPDVGARRATRLHATLFT